MSELELQEFIENNFEDFKSFIINYNDFLKELEQQKINIYNKDGKILISDLIKLSAIKRLKISFSMLDNLKLISKEFQLLKTGKRGKQPSIDLFAYNTSNFCNALIELKINNVSEREAVSELSAYSQGLQNRFRGLSNLETLWVPVSPEWRTTLKSAVEYILIWQNILVSPLKLNIQNEDLSTLSLECYNPINELTEIESLNMFSYDCFDAFEFYLIDEVKSYHALNSFIVSTCAKLNISGFVISHKPVKDMYPHGFTICVFNPYKGYMHKRLCLNFINEESEEELYKVLSQENKVIDFNYSDIDFVTDELKGFIPEQNEIDQDIKVEELSVGDLMPKSWKKDFLGIEKFADNEVGININFLYNEVRKSLESNGYKSKSLGYPDFQGRFKQIKDESVNCILPFGVHQELIFNKVKVEHHRKIHDYDLFEITSKYSYYKSLFEDYNMKTID